MPTAMPVPDSPDLSHRLPKLTPRRTRPNEGEESNPPPATPALPPARGLQGVEYVRPKRRILSPRDHEIFLVSDTHRLIVGFLFTLSDSVRNVKVTEVEQSEAARDPVVVAILHVLDEVDRTVQQCPPRDTGSRFGNVAFRTFLAHVVESMPEWHAHLGVTDLNALSETCTYFSHSFGDESRIDYGSGHELNFALWLLCLRQLSIVKDDVFPALALVVFPRYLKVMRAIQSTYYLEPAGSHGVWGLDDYQFLPFLIGASQLVDHKHIRPRSIRNNMIIEECGPDYLYLDQVGWVNSTKTVQGLRWHSPMLDDISAAKSWAKVEAGMKRMFLAEVLGKLPVAQHLLFGTLLPAPEGMSDSTAELLDGLKLCECDSGEDGSVHDHKTNSWGDCCGIKVPSAIGARTEAMKRGEESGLRRIPFD